MKVRKDNIVEVQHVVLQPSGQYPSGQSQSVVLASNHNILPVSVTVSGQQAKAQSLSIVLASDTGNIAVSGQFTMPSGNVQIGKVIITNSGLDVNIDQRGGRNALSVQVLDANGNQITTFGSSPVALTVSGQKIASDSQSVVLASNHNVIPVSVSVSGQQTKANSISMTMASDQNVLPVSIIASGQQTAANSQSVVLASTQPTVAISGNVSGVIQVLGSQSGLYSSMVGVAQNTVVAIPAGNPLPGRNMITICNISSTITLYVAPHGGVASNNFLYLIAAEESRDIQCDETTRLYGIRTAGSGNISYMEWKRQ